MQSLYADPEFSGSLYLVKVVIMGSNKEKKSERICFCVTDDRYNALVKRARMLDVSVGLLVQLLLGRVKSDQKKEARTLRSVEYQPVGEGYSITTVRVRAQDKEFALSARYLFKKSVSNLIRIAIDKYLDEIIAEKEAEVAQGVRFDFSLGFVDIFHQFENEDEKWVIWWRNWNSA